MQSNKIHQSETKSLEKVGKTCDRRRRRGSYLLMSLRGSCRAIKQLAKVGKRGTRRQWVPYTCIRAYA